MDKKQQTEMLQNALDHQLEDQNVSQPAQEKTENEALKRVEPGQKPDNTVPVEDNRTFGVGEWMITILFFLLPIINIIVMAIWAFSSKGNVHRKNLSRACLLWLIILLIGYIVAMTVAGYTIFDIFTIKG